MHIEYPGLGKIQLHGAIGLDGTDPQREPLETYASSLMSNLQAFQEGRKPEFVLYVHLQDPAHSAIHEEFLNLTGISPELPEEIEGEVYPEVVLETEEGGVIVRTVLPDSQGQISALRYQGVESEDRILQRKIATAASRVGQTAFLRFD